LTSTLITLSISTFFTSERLTFSPIYLYQKDEWALPGDLRSRKCISVFPLRVLPLTTHTRSLIRLSLSSASNHYFCFHCVTEWTVFRFSDVTGLSLDSLARRISQGTSDFYKFFFTFYFILFSHHRFVLWYKYSLLTYLGFAPNSAVSLQQKRRYCDKLNYIKKTHLNFKSKFILTSGHLRARASVCVGG
jgi:hypothetical protein